MYVCMFSVFLFLIINCIHLVYVYTSNGCAAWQQGSSATECHADGLRSSVFRRGNSVVMMQVESAMFAPPCEGYKLELVKTGRFFHHCSYNDTDCRIEFYLAATIKWFHLTQGQRCAA